ncbi:MAG: agmatinase [Deltaproteobacteria bacterium]|nr:agmatinase [Deltaproteobacteria bacterium]
MDQQTLTFRTLTTATDKKNIAEIVSSSGFFYQNEIDLAVELVTEELEKGAASGYHFIFIESGGQPVGYTCFGPIPATTESYDLYWIALHRDWRGRGLGRILLQKSEKAIFNLGGRRLYIETAGRELYAPTRAFYLTCGYREAAIFHDFYAPGDAKHVYLKIICEKEGPLMEASHCNFHGEDVEPARPEEALFHVIPVPYEKTVSYQEGTRQGPQAILDASCQLELFDSRSQPARHGIYTRPSIDCQGEDETVLARLTAAVEDSLQYNCVPVVLGGEHTITLATVRALKKKYSRFGVIQFDAHADLRQSYQGSALSHACVMRRLHDENIPFFQIGTRSYSYEEQIFRESHNIPYVDAETIFKEGVDQVKLPEDFPEKIFITFDIDCFDPALIPATGTPVPGGLTWYQVQWLIEKILQNRIGIGFDVVELAPHADLHSASFAAAQLVYNIMGFLSRSQCSRKYWKLT